MCENLNNLEEQLLDYKTDLLSMIAYNAHGTLCTKIKEFLETRKQRKEFRVSEYFLCPPLTKKETKSDILAPFLRSIAEIENPIIPNAEKIDKFLDNSSNNETSIPAPEEFLAPKSCALLMQIYKRAIRYNFNADVSKIGWGMYQKWKLNQLKEFNWKNHIKTKTKKELDNYYKDIFLSDVNKHDKRGLLMEFLLCDCLFKFSNMEQICLITYPIASESVFYGFIICYIPLEDRESNKAIIRQMRIIVDGYFLPLSVVFENCWLETLLHDGFDNDRYYIRYNANIEDNKICCTSPNQDKATHYIYDVIFLSDIVKSSNNIFENKFSEIWQSREDWWHNDNKKPLVKKSLHFSNFFLASQEMLEIIKYVMQLELKKTKTTKKLPSVLVVGGSGSGKETISKIIALFSAQYRESNCHPINLALLKPPAMAPSLLMGIDADINDARFSVKGILQKILQPNEQTVLILDELNSLDIDAQGGLLRFLEEGEVVPLGGFSQENNKAIDVLLIGVMNEDPERLTKESFLQQFIKEGSGGSFGGVFSEIAYEYLRKIRRLRDDLYYRFIRGGKVKLPTLDERKEDISILFYTFCMNNLKEKRGKYERLYISFEVLDIVKNEIKWPGNVRQLQTFAPIVVRFSIERTKEENKMEQTEKGNILTVTKKDICKAINETGGIKPSICHILDELMHE